MPDRSDDRFLYWPIFAALGWPLLFALTWSGSFLLAFVGAPLVLFAWAMSGCAAVLICVVWAYERSLLRLLSTVILPATALIAAINLAIVWRTGQLAGGYVHLFAAYPAYLSEISKLPTDEPRFAVFVWDGFLQIDGVIYDESDEITSDHPSPTWKERAKRAGADHVFGYTRALNHFYFVTLD